MNAAVAAAPHVGSYITMYFHWQGNFIALLAFGLLVPVMTVFFFFFIPAAKLPVNKKTIAVTSYKEIFQSKPLMLLIVNLIFKSLPYWIFLGMSSIVYIEGLGVKGLAHYGYYQGAWALVFALGSIIMGLIVSKYDQKRMLLISNYICIFSLICIASVTMIDSKNPLFISLAFLVFSISEIIPSVILYPSLY